MAFIQSSADLVALNTNVNLRVRDAYLAYKPTLRGFAIEARSTSKREAYPAQAISARLQRWNGNRPATNLIQKTIYIQNEKPWALKIPLARADIELLGNTLSTANAAAQLGKAAKALPDEVIVDLLQNGASRTCIDDSNFFSATHPVVPWDASYSTFTNLRTAFPLNRANFRTAYQAMRGLRGWDLQPLVAEKFYLLVDPTLEATAQEIVESDFAAMPGGSNTDTVGARNVDRGKAEIRVSPKLVNEPGVWYLLSVENPPSGRINPEADFGAEGNSPLAGPFVIQEWRGLEVVVRTDPQTEAVFERDEYDFGVSRGMEGGYLLPHHAVRCEPT